MQTARKEYVRTSTSIPRENYEQLENLAAQNKVSVAWIVRDAIEKYLEAKEEHDVQ